MRRFYLVLGPALVAGLLLVTLPSSATGYNPMGPYASPAPGEGIPGPANVPGLEFSDRVDRDAANPSAADPEQNIAWDGTGGTANTFDYSGTRTLANGTVDIDRQVDALGNTGEALFEAVAYLNAAALLFSVSGDPNIYFEAISGASGTWATPAMIDRVTAVTDVDALEVWGPAGGPDSPADDANVYSLENDANGVAVWYYGGASSTAWVTVAEIGEAIGLDDSLWGLLDLDGLMMYGDAMLFSIAPIRTVAGGLVYDGGEIWVWDGSPNSTAAFLNHGGHVWDTAFDVRATFGVQSENINALEAVATIIPEPASLALLALGLGALALRRPFRT